MKDSRVKLFNFITLSITFSSCTLNFVPFIALLTLVISVLYYKEFIENLGIIFLSSAAILTLGLVAWFISPELDFYVLLVNYFRWVSLIIISVIFFVSINLFEFVASMAYFKIPVKIAIAFGVGLRFLPVLVDEAKRVTRIQHQNGFTVSFSNIHKFGFVTLLNRLLSPIVISILRKTDSITISVTVQQIETRIRDYNFNKINLSDIFSLLFCSFITLTSLIYT